MLLGVINNLCILCVYFFVPFAVKNKPQSIAKFFAKGAKDG
jgi:hypothetical protein